MSKFWDNRFGKEEYIYGVLPNQFFKEQLDELNPGKILLPADGEGRNGVYAASKGWKVDAFDSSIEGKKKAMKLAGEKSVDINYIISSYEDYNPKGSRYDVIALIFAHMPSTLRKAFHLKIKEWLNPGGRIILEAFHKFQLNRNSGGPKDVDLLYDLDDLNHDFDDMTVIYSNSVFTNLAEGNHHVGPASVVRLVLEKI